MEYEQIQSGVSISPLELADHSEFEDSLDLNNEYIDNSDSNEMVFGLSW
jgi:hypothetical protein